MVQSIWIQFDEKQLNNKIVKKIIKIVKNKYRVFGDPRDNALFLKFLDCNQINIISNKLRLNIDDKKFCDCGCYSTNFERFVWFIDLEFNFGKQADILDIYFRIGRNVWGSVGMYKERLNVLRYILEDLIKEFNNQGIKCKLDLSDCEQHYFKDYALDKPRRN